MADESYCKFSKLSTPDLLFNENFPLRLVRYIPDSNR